MRKPTAPESPVQTVDVGAAAASAAFSAAASGAHVDDPLAGVSAMKASDGVVNLAVRQPNATYLSFKVRVPDTVTFELVA